MLKRTSLSFFIFFLQIGASLAQNTNPTERFTDDQLVAGELYVLDTVINGKTYFRKDIKTESSSILESKPAVSAPFEAIKTDSLVDDALASSIDNKWLESLYNNTIFDTIYRDVTNLDYKAVYYPELSTDTLKARLARLNSKTPFNVEYNPSLESVIKSFLSKRQKYFERLMGLSKYYFPMFEAALDKYNIPLEIKYLAIVESALKPRARSRVGATGLWQFMYQTGLQYKLEVNSYVDERSDPIKATEAACKYLSKLYEIFGDWDLALAAYNSGPGNVSKAIRRSGGYKNYWNIRHNLPRETAGYVPAFLATMYIFEYAETHGLIQHKPKFHHIQTDTLHVKSIVSLDQVSEFTGIPIETLQFLNPAYKLDIIPHIKGKNYTLRLPRAKIGKFVQNEAQFYAFAKAEFDKREKPLPQLFKQDRKTTYRVKQGDYLGKIARRFGVRVSHLKRWNGLRSNNLRIGQRLTIYPRNSQGFSKSTKLTIPKNFNGKTYKVQSGDSLWSISQKFSGVSVKNIKDWNGISGNKLKIGMTLRISKH